MLQPTLHRPIPMSSRVIVSDGFLEKESSGTVVGIAYQHVIFGYVVLLDEPVFVNARNELHAAIVVPGSFLRVVDESKKD